MEFNKEQTNIAKGTAICLMFAHHLYPFEDRFLNGNNYISLIPFFNVEAPIGMFGGICVSMFLFLSGYGMYLGFLRSNKSALKYSLVKVKEFYFTYWLYFVIFVSIGILFFPKVTLWHSEQVLYSMEPIIFIENFVGWESTYNGEWWFVRIFVFIILFLFPLYAKLAATNVALVVFPSLFLFSLSSYVSAYGKFGFIFWQTSFALGVICARSKFFESQFIEYIDKSGWIWVFSWLSLCFFLKTSGFSYDFLIVPFFIYFSIRAIVILRWSRLFAYLGKHSFALWLIHSFFCYYYFQDIIYFPKWSPLIFMLLTTMSLLSVVSIEFLRSCSLQLLMSNKRLNPPG